MPFKVEYYDGYDWLNVRDDPHDSSFFADREEAMRAWLHRVQRNQAARITALFGPGGAINDFTCSCGHVRWAHWANGRCAHCECVKYDGKGVAGTITL